MAGHGAARPNRTLAGTEHSLQTEAAVARQATGDKSCCSKRFLMQRSAQIFRQDSGRRAASPSPPSRRRSLALSGVLSLVISFYYFAVFCVATRRCVLYFVNIKL